MPQGRFRLTTELEEEKRGSLRTRWTTPTTPSALPRSHAPISTSPARPSAFGQADWRRGYPISLGRQRETGEFFQEGDRFRSGKDPWNERPSGCRGRIRPGLGHADPAARRTESTGKLSEIDGRGEPSFDPAPRRRVNVGRVIVHAPTPAPVRRERQPARPTQILTGRFRGGENVWGVPAFLVEQVASVGVVEGGGRTLPSPGRPSTDQPLPDPTPTSGTCQTLFRGHGPCTSIRPSDRDSMAQTPTLQIDPAPGAQVMGTTG